MLSIQDAQDGAKTNNFYIMEDLQKLLPAADLTALLATQQIEEDAVRVGEVKLTEACGSLFNDKNLDTMKALLRFGFLRKSANYLNQDMQEAMLTYTMAYAGVSMDISSMDDERKFSLYETMANSQIKELLQTYMEQAYVDNYASAEAKADVENMLWDLIATFRQRIENLEWMSGATKERAIQKLDAIKIRVGYPDQWETPSLYENRIKQRAEP